MRYVAIAVVLLSLPLFINLLRQYPHRRVWAFTAIGLLLFCGDKLRIDAALIAWPLWKGISSGIGVSPVDTLALALLATRGQGARRLPFWGFFAFYVAALGLSIFQASVPLATVFVLWAWLRLLLLFAVLGAEVSRPEACMGLFKGLSLGLILQAGYVIPQKLSGVVQATGAMYHQNTLGMMTELALLPLIAAMLAGFRGRLLQVGVVAGLIVVVGGGSRGALGMVFSGIAALALLSLARNATPRKFKIVGGAVLALAVATPFAMMTLKDRFGTQSVTTQESQRAAFERAALAMASDHPFGVGANLYVSTANVQGYAERAGVAWNYANRSAPVHNAYLLARAETGWLGQIAYTLMLLAPLIYGLRFAFRDRKSAGGELVLGSSVALGVMLFHNQYEFAGLEYPTLAVAIANIALIAGLPRTRARSRPEPRAGYPRPLRSPATPPHPIPIA